MRIFVNHLIYLRIFHILQVLQCFLVCLFRQVMHHNHLKIMLTISKPNQVSYPSMRLHNKINKFLIHRISVILQQFFKLFLLFSHIWSSFFFKSIQSINQKLNNPRNKKTSLTFIRRFQFMKSCIQIYLKTISSIIWILLQKFKKYFFKCSICLTKIFSCFLIFPLWK